MDKERVAEGRVRFTYTAPVLLQIELFKSANLWAGHCDFVGVSTAFSDLTAASCLQQGCDKSQHSKAFGSSNH